MRFTVLGLLTAGLATLASAQSWTTPTGDPEGNPIASPSLDEIVPKGAPYEVTWDPTTEGTVTILLLRGPSTNVVPLYAIAEKIDNTGTFTWTPKSDLEVDTTHYGLQLIVDSTGQYQYSTQFGIGASTTDGPVSNYDYGYSSSSSTVESSYYYGSSTTDAASSYYYYHPTGASSYPTPYPTSHNSTYSYPTSYYHNSTAPTTSKYLTTSKYAPSSKTTTTTERSTYVAPSNTESAPTSSPTGAAGKVGFSIGAAGVIGGVVAVLGL